MEKHGVVLIEGDGIGPEIAAAVVKIFDVAEIPIDWVPARAGLACVHELGTGCPDETLDAIRKHGVALKCPTTTPIGGGHISINVTIRKALDLYVNVRPSRTLPGVDTRFKGINLLVMRENIEDTYGGIEHMQTDQVAQCLRVATRPGIRKFMRFCFEMARQQNRKRVVCVHKANIMKLTDGMFLDVFRETATEFRELQTSDMLIDHVCMRLVSDPQDFDMIVLPNLFGDIVSDLCAGLVGGLGVAPGGNIGSESAVFEAVHGSAPDIAGLGRANPTALLLSGVAMLRHLGLMLDAQRVERALRLTLKAGIKTGDLGGNCSTDEFTDAICREIERIKCDDEHALEHHPHATRVEMPKLAPTTRKERKVVGFDMFVEDREFPTMPEKVGPFNLTLISNRGATLWPGERPDIMMVNWHRCRYLAKGDVADADVMKAVSELDGKVQWVHIEKLHTFDGKEGYSLAR